MISPEEALALFRARSQRVIRARYNEHYWSLLILRALKIHCKEKVSKNCKAPWVRRESN
jgi:hypothetical protein